METRTWPIYAFDGVEVHANARTFTVSWMSDWSRWLELKDAGYFTTRDGGPGTYGHTDVIVAPEYR